MLYFILTAWTVTVCLTMPIILCLFSFLSCFSELAGVAAVMMVSKQSQSHQKTPEFKSLCAINPSYKGVKGYWAVYFHIPTHTTILTFSSGIQFLDYLREKTLSFIWQWQITGWPWPPSAHLQYNFSVVISVRLSLPSHLSSQTSITSPWPSSHISSLVPPSHLCLLHSSPLSSPLPIHLRAAEAHSRPHFVAPSIMTYCRPNRSRGKKRNEWFKSILLSVGWALQYPSWSLNLKTSGRSNFDKSGAQQWKQMSVLSYSLAHNCWHHFDSLHWLFWIINQDKHFQSSLWKW